MIITFPTIPRKEGPCPNQLGVAIVAVVESLVPSLVVLVVFAAARAGTGAAAVPSLNSEDDMFARDATQLHNTTQHNTTQLNSNLTTQLDNTT